MSAVGGVEGYVPMVPFNPKEEEHKWQCRFVRGRSSIHRVDRELSDYHVSGGAHVFRDAARDVAVLRLDTAGPALVQVDVGIELGVEALRELAFRLLDAALHIELNPAPKEV